MHERLLPASPNWYCSRCSDTNDKGLLGFGARNSVYLVDVTATSCAVVGELVGHKERVSGVSFCTHEGQSHLCASASDDGSVKFWDTDEKLFLKEHRAHQSTITALHWSPSEKHLVVSGDEKGVVVCYRYNTGDTSSFFPEPRNIFSLACSPHTWNHVALGYKDGMIVLIDVAKKGEVIHRLRGHDDEIHALAWAPVANEEGLYSRPGDITETTNGESEGSWREQGVAAGRGCYLASGSKDQTLRIWSTAKGKGVMTLKLPFLKRRGAAVDPGVRERLWLSVHWPRRKPTQVVTSCFGGELVLWDLTRTGKQKWSLLGAAADGQNHSRIVFNMSSVCLPDGREILISTSMDREVKCWDLTSLECCWSLPSLGGFVYSLAFSPVAQGCLALGVGDSMLRVWNTLALHNRYDTRLFWQGIKAKVTALAWHPTREGSLAFGTDDGKVGVYEVFSNKPPAVSSSYHRKTVYTLAWGPPVPPLSFGPSEERAAHSLYSCAGEGVILQHDPWNLGAEASDIDRLIKDTNSIKHKLSPHTDLSWKPDGRVVAIGNEDGSIEVYQAPSLRLLCSIQQHHKIINCLRWHPHHVSSQPPHDPAADPQPDPQPDLQYLLASGSSNALVYVHNLRTIIENPPETAVVMTEAYRSLAGHTAKITSLAWSPHHPARLATVCYDGTAQVWDVLKEEGVVNYRGHRGRLLCVQWSPVEPDLVWTGGDDFTTQEWNTTKQPHTVPPKGKKMADLRDKTKSKAKKKKKEAPGKEMCRPGESPSPVPIAEKKGGGGVMAGGGEKVSEEEEESETTTSTSSVAAAPASGQMDRAAAGEKAQNGRKSFSVKRELKKEKPEVSSVKKRKPRSMLPLSTSMDHRPRENMQADCLALAGLSHTQDPPAQCVPGQGDHIQLGLFSDRQALYRMLREEEQGHVEAGHPDMMVYLRLWTGDVAGLLALATEKGELNDHLLSLAPMAGYQVWNRTVQAYVKQLCLQEQYLKAASHLLSIHKIYEAIDLLKSHQLYREGIALAKARLQPDDPVLKDLYISWAAVLEKDGHLATTAKCYLAAGQSVDAVKVLAKKSDAASLRAAAGLARVCGEAELSISLALRCAKDLAATQHWLEAQQLLSTQDSLLAHRLHFCTMEMLSVRLSGCGVVTWASSSNNPWALPRGESAAPTEEQAPLPGLVRRVWEEEFRVVEEDREKWRALQQTLRAMEVPPPSPNTPVKQLLSQLALGLTLAWMEAGRGAALELTWRSLARARTAGQLALEAELCHLLFPGGIESVVRQPPLLAAEEKQEEVWGVRRSLEALASYHWLYRYWWSLSNKGRLSQKTSGEPRLQASPQPQNGPALDSEPLPQARDVTVGGVACDVQQNGHAEAVGGEVVNGGDGAGRPGEELRRSCENVEKRSGEKVDGKSGEEVQRSGEEVERRTRSSEEVQRRCRAACHALLSEPHAAYQASHRAIAEIQQRLASLVAQHSSARDTAPSAGEAQTDSPDQRSDEESLPSLIAMVTERHKELAGLPDNLKEYPYPDVLECCLVILRLSQCCPLVVEPAQLQIAKSLLRKHGTSPGLRKAAQPFLS